MTQQTFKNVFLAKKVKNGKVQKFWSKKFFRSDPIQSVLKRILKRKSQNQKFHTITKIFPGLTRFLAKIVKKWQSQKNFGRKSFLVGID